MKSSAGTDNKGGKPTSRMFRRWHRREARHGGVVEDYTRKPIGRGV